MIMICLILIVLRMYQKRFYVDAFSKHFQVFSEKNYSLYHAFLFTQTKGATISVCVHQKIMGSWQTDIA